MIHVPSLVTFDHSIARKHLHQEYSNHHNGRREQISATKNTKKHYVYTLTASPRNVECYGIKY